MVWTKIYKKHLRNISASNWRSFKKHWAQTSQLSRFIVSHMVSLPSLQSHGRFFISHGFTNFKWIFSQTRNFLRKQTRQHNPLSKKHCSIVIYMQKKLIILQSFVQRLALGGFMEIAVPWVTKNFMKNIYQLMDLDGSIILIKSVIFRDSFSNNLEIS